MITASDPIDINNDGSEWSIILRVPVGYEFEYATPVTSTAIEINFSDIEIEGGQIAADHPKIVAAMAGPTIEDKTVVSVRFKKVG